MSTIKTGTTLTTAYQVEGDTTGALVIQTGSTPTTAMTIDGSQNVGIGTSSPLRKLHIVDNTYETQLLLRESDSSGPQLLIGADSSVSGSIINASSVSGANNNLILQTGGTERARIDSSGNFQFNSGYGSVATAYGCRAWVSFNGTGTVAIRGSGNVSSITDNGTGNYTVNYTTAMPDANYAVNGTVGDTTNNYGSALVFGSRANLWTQLTSSISFIVSISSVNYDATNINVSVFR